MCNRWIMINECWVGECCSFTYVEIAQDGVNWTQTFKMTHPPIITSHPCTNQLTRLAWIVSSKFLVSFLCTQPYSLDMIWWVPGWLFHHFSLFFHCPTDFNTNHAHLDLSSEILVSFVKHNNHTHLDMIWWVPGWYYTLRCNLSIQQLLTLHPGLSLHTLDLFLQVWCVLCVSTYITNELIVSTDFSFVIRESIPLPNTTHWFNQMLSLCSCWIDFLAMPCVDVWQ